ncbi:unnamed protein product [Closterium sp. Naga37s-1]|nr:unnamed protein product [Closterium sp. Naga37s-1]
MADQEAPGWREKAGAFISSSSFKLKAAGSAVAGAAGEAGSKVKTSWQQNVQPKVAEAATRAAVAAEGAKSRMHTTWESTKESWNTKVLPRMEAGLETTARVAADTGSMLKQGLMETTEKVKASRVGQQLTELTANGMERSKGLLQKVDWRRGRPGAPGDATLVFGTPLDAFASRQRGTAVPFVVIQCCNFILQNGLVTEYLFESENDSRVVKGLMHMFDTDPNADIPSDTSPLDVGQLLLVYLKCLPEPLMTFSLFSGVATVGSSDVTQLRRLLHTLPAVNLETLHAVLCLLYRVSLHADVNKMDAQSLAAEFAPVLLWPRPEGSAASAAAAGGSGSGGGGGGGGGGDAMASPAMRRAQSEKGMRVGDGGSAAAAAATVSAGPAVVEANGESSVPGAHMPAHMLPLPRHQVLQETPEFSEWTLKYTAFGRDLEFSWLSKQLTPIANQKIQWRSVDGVPNRGAVRFFPRGTNGCKVEVRRGDVGDCWVSLFCNTAGWNC